MYFVLIYGVSLALSSRNLESILSVSDVFMTITQLGYLSKLDFLKFFKKFLDFFNLRYINV